MKDPIKDLGKNIKSLRQANGLTQKELADELGVSLRHLQNIEYGKVDLNISTLHQTAEFFNVSIDSFFSKADVDHNALTYLDFLPVGIQVCNRDGLVIYSNNTSIKYQGYNRVEVCMKMHIWDFVADPDEREDLKKYLKYLLKEVPKPTPYLSTNLTKSGKKIDVHCNWSYIFDDSREVIGFITTIAYL